MTETIDPRRSALLVMDYQNGVVDTLGEPDDLLSRASEAIATVRGAAAGDTAHELRHRNRRRQHDRCHLGRDQHVIPRQVPCPEPGEAFGRAHAGSAAPQIPGPR
jgi:hypothetical protein